MEAPGSVKCAGLCDPPSGCRLLCLPTGSRAQQEASPPPPPGPQALPGSAPPVLDDPVWTASSWPFLPGDSGSGGWCFSFLLPKPSQAEPRRGQHAGRLRGRWEGPREA